MPRKPKTTPRIVECTWCGESVTAKCLLRHLRGRCAKAPKETAEQKFCPDCQQLLDRSKFSKSSQYTSGLVNACKGCSLARFHQWRKDHAGEPRRTRPHLSRPGKWVFHDCPHCGKPYSFTALVYHAPRCPSKPDSRMGSPLDPTIVVPEHTPEAQCSPDIEDMARARRLKFAYNITLKERNRMFSEQGGLCLICQQPSSIGITTSKRMRGLHVDHDHATGKIRGLLCHFCNVGIGHFQEDIGRMESAIAYLRSHKSETE